MATEHLQPLGESNGSYKHLEIPVNAENCVEDSQEVGMDERRWGVVCWGEAELHFTRVIQFTYLRKSRGQRKVLFLIVLIQKIQCVDKGS